MLMSVGRAPHPDSPVKALLEFCSRCSTQRRRRLTRLDDHLEKH